MLILHLKRFQPNWRTGTYEKRQGVVKFDPTIDLSDFCAGDVAEPLPPPPKDEDDGGAATQNLQSRFDAASPARNDRKRKKADSDSDDSSRASSPSSARSAKTPRTASKAFIEFKAQHAKKLRAFKEQHTKTCGKTDHDYCQRFVGGQPQPQVASWRAARRSAEGFCTGLMTSLRDDMCLRVHMCAVLSWG